MLTKFVHIRDGNLAVRVYEPAIHRADALLIHGYTGSKEDFSFIGPRLADAGYRVVTSDNRGQYQSDHSSRDDAYTIASLARDHYELAEHFRLERPHLFGHSFGGLVAQRAAVEYPDAWRSLTIFCSGPHGMSDWTDLQRDIEFLEAHSMSEKWEQELAEKNARLNFPEVRKERWLASDKRSVIAHAKQLLSEQSIVDRVRDTGLPIHVIRGEYDDAWPHDLQETMATDLGAPLTVIPNAGHCPNEDQPIPTAAKIASFWSKFTPRL